jgi:adenylate cyclase
VLTFLLLTLLTFHRLGERLEYSWLDLLYTWRAPQPAPSQLLVVGIDEPSFQELGQAWPWPRRLHAALVRRLQEAGARLIVFDVVFADPTTSDDDASLSQALRQTGNVILAEDLDIVKDPHFSRQILVQPYKPLRQAALALGLAGVQPDPDGVVRHFHLKIRDRDTLAAAAVRAFEPGLNLPEQVHGLINYAGPSRSLDTVSYYQVLDPDRPLPAARIRGRLVLIGRILGASPSPQARSDTFYTPYYFWNGQVSSGVEIHGQIIHTLLSGRWGREIPEGGRLGLFLAATLLGAYGLARFSPLPGLGVLLGVVLAILGISACLFIYWNFWAPPVLLVAGLGIIYAGMVLDNYLVEAREKRWLRQAFSRYLSPAVIEIITANPEQLRLGGEEVEGTVLFADLAGFTSLSENIPPGDLIRVLNEYFSPLTRIILAHRGTLDKYIGDAIMAFWGAPIAMPDHARQACQAALAMGKVMPGLQNGWRNLGFPPLKTRMGLHSGSLIAGNVGSLERFDYTVLGDTVNLASRLEGVNKLYGTTTLLSEACYRLVAEQFLVRELDVIQVQGRVQPVTIYELLGEASQSIPGWLEIFVEGREWYKKQDWARAENCFQEVLHLKPGDPPAQLYFSRVRHYQNYPPPPNWQGVFKLDGK